MRLQAPLTRSSRCEQSADSLLWKCAAAFEFQVPGFGRRLLKLMLVLLQSADYVFHTASPYLLGEFWRSKVSLSIVETHEASRVLQTSVKGLWSVVTVKNT